MPSPPECRLHRNAVSTGIRYAVEIAGDASEDDLRQLVVDSERDASIPLTLRHATEVRAGDITVRTTG
jgi:putative redox protein